MSDPAEGPRPPGSYGVDAPVLLLVPVFFACLGVVQAMVLGSWWPIGGVVAIMLLCGFGLYANRRGKFVVWRRQLNQLDLDGDESILDLGCGRGTVLILAAQRLTSGCAVGVDVWRKDDQSGNGPEATLRNAALAGVAAQVAVRTASMTALPFADASFDLVVSSVAVHNVRSRAARRTVLAEAVRVLRPGGTLLIADLSHTAEYCRELTKAQMHDVCRRNLGPAMWWSGPWLATRMVRATKPRFLDQDLPGS